MSCGKAISLRAAHDEDRAFLERVYAESRADELAATNWTATEKEIFCQDQFAAQDRHYRLHYPHCAYQIVMRDGRPIGRLYVDRRPTEIRIVDLALLTAERGQGCGGHLLAEILAEGRRLELPVSIHVERTNPARRLYDRLGFCLVEEGEVYDLLECSPL